MWDWHWQVVLRKKAPTASQAKSKTAVNAALQTGAARIDGGKVFILDLAIPKIGRFLALTLRCPGSVGNGAGADVTTVKKFDAGANKAHKGVPNAAKLDQETEDFHLEQVSSELKKQIQQARMAKKMTQAQVGWLLVEWRGVLGHVSIARVSVAATLYPHIFPLFHPLFDNAVGTDDQREATGHQRVRERQGHPQPPGKCTGIGCRGLQLSPVQSSSELSTRAHNKPFHFCAPQILSKLSRVLGVTLKKNPGKK